MDAEHLNSVFADAVRDNNLELVETLLEHGADPNQRDLSDMGIPLLSKAILEGRLTIARKLVAAGADPNAADSLGRTPLIYAAATGASGLVKILIQANASKTVEDRQGFRARLVALYRGHRSVANLL